MKLFTIGHSAHPIEKFIELLKLHHIHILVDVRSVPASRFHPQFRKRALARTLAEQDIQYVFLGQQLGGRPSDPTCYKDGVLPEKYQKPWPKPDYAKVMQREWFIWGIEQLLGYVRKQRTAILCSEEKPALCHRHLLIAEYLKQYHSDVEVLHIRGSGTLQNANSGPGDEASEKQLTIFHNQQEV